MALLAARSAILGALAQGASPALLQGARRLAPATAAARALAAAATPPPQQQQPPPEPREEREGEGAASAQPAAAPQPHAAAANAAKPSADSGQGFAAAGEDKREGAAGAGGASNPAAPGPAAAGAAGAAGPGGLTPHARRALQAHLAQLAALRGETRLHEQTSEDAAPAWLRAAADAAGGLLQRLTAGFLTARVETEFDLDEWLEGSMDAFWTVNRLLGEGDYAALRPMVSAKLLAALEETRAEYAAAGLAWRVEVAEAPFAAQLRGAALWRPAQVAEYGPPPGAGAGAAAGAEAAAGEAAGAEALPSAEAKGAPPSDPELPAGAEAPDAAAALVDAGVPAADAAAGAPGDAGAHAAAHEAAAAPGGAGAEAGGAALDDAGPAGQWLVLTVQLRAVATTIVSQVEGGQVVARLTDKRPAVWRFATGPLPARLPQARLDTPWWLVTIE